MILGPPETLDSATLAFCAAISGQAPVYVPVRPAPNTKVAYCFDNSVAFARLHGGEALYGWAIWRWPGRWFEAEHHAVWRGPAGELTDVTPQAGDPPRILFLPDPTAPYDPTTFRRNIMAPDSAVPMTAGALAPPDHRQETERAGQPRARTDVTGFTPVTVPLHELAREYIALAHARTDITSTYWSRGIDVLPLFRPEDQRRLDPIDGRMRDLLEEMRAEPQG